ncbi:hypothetical protein I4U23_031471 [Adineta vaga]|nr:hypothetical protein I4U23_031471 [Adineta vaga]
MMKINQAYIQSKKDEPEDVIQSTKTHVIRVSRHRRSFDMKKQERVTRPNPSLSGNVIYVRIKSLPHKHQSQNSIRRSNNVDNDHHNVMRHTEKRHPSSSSTRVKNA